MFVPFVVAFQHVKIFCVVSIVEAQNPGSGLHTCFCLSIKAMTQAIGLTTTVLMDYYEVNKMLTLPKEDSWRMESQNYPRNKQKKL